MAKEKPVKWVKSWRSIPEADLRKGGVRKGQEVGLRGINANDAIYLIKGKAGKSTELHEQYHNIKRHPAKERDPRMYVLHEIEANMYSFKKIHQPSHQYEHLLGIFIDVHLSTYKETTAKTLRYIHNALKQVKAPPSWFEDYRRLEKYIHNPKYADSLYLPK